MQHEPLNIGFRLFICFSKYILRKNSCTVPAFQLWTYLTLFQLEVSTSSNYELISHLISTCEPTVYLSPSYELWILKLYLTPLPPSNLHVFQMWIYLSVSLSSNWVGTYLSSVSSSELTVNLSHNLFTTLIIAFCPTLNLSRIFFSTLNLSRTFFPSGILSPTFFSTLNCSLWLSILYIYLSMGYF